MELKASPNSSGYQNALHDFDNVVRICGVHTVLVHILDGPSYFNSKPMAVRSRSDLQYPAWSFGLEGDSQRWPQIGKVDDLFTAIRQEEADAQASAGGRLAPPPLLRNDAGGLHGKHASPPRIAVDGGEGRIQHAPVEALRAVGGDLSDVLAHAPVDQHRRCCPACRRPRGSLGRHVGDIQRTHGGGRPRIWPHRRSEGPFARHIAVEGAGPNRLQRQGIRRQAHGVQEALGTGSQRQARQLCANPRTEVVGASAASGAA
mmetsp:Transcript_33397/g.85110  ORF Transcript_33397/g.85110 Transcript_33397/m.85110 type:complete len:260 (-) Transcript_33397:514-1293(-)